MRTINILSGLPGSGKTTFVKENAKQGDIVMHRDNFRKLLQKRCPRQKVTPNSKFEFESWTYSINANLRKPNDLWIDQTTLGMNSLKKLLNGMRLTRNDRIIVHVIDTALDECIKRNSARSSSESVAENVLRHMHASATKQPITQNAVNRMFGRGIEVIEWEA